MYKFDKYVVIIMFVISSILFFLAKFDYGTQFYSSAITFLSITFGFVITSISILFNSKYVKSYYKIKDSEDKNITLLHRLTRYYKLQIYFTLILILFYIFLSVLAENNLGYIYLECFNIPLLVLNCFITYILVKFLLKLFVSPQSN